MAWTPLLAGGGARMAREAIELIQHTADVGVDGGLITYPCYTWIANGDIVRHHGSDGDGVDIPIVIYNIPAYELKYQTGTTVHLNKYVNISLC